MIYGLNTIRFVCALSVMFAHFGRPAIGGIVDKSTPLGLLIVGIYNNLTPGQPAVIVFFVISGLCIHYPYCKDLRVPDLKEYFARRYIRILVPLLSAIAIATYVIPVNLALFDLSILWSLVAELIYYTIYPGLLIVRRRLGSWQPLIIATLVIGLIIASTEPLAGNYPSFGMQLNWLLGLPCWLLGCWLAEFVSRHKDEQSAQSTLPFGSIYFSINIWIVRFAILFTAAFLSIAKFHSPLGYPWTLNFFAVAATLWLVREIYHFQAAKPPRVLEWAGAWSYSLYLCHILAMGFIDQVAFPKVGLGLDWPMQVLFILVFCYVFALIFEFPSHAAARRISKALASRKQRNLQSSNLSQLS